MKRLRRWQAPDDGDFHAATLGSIPSIPADSHITRWWCQEGCPAKTASAHCRRVRHCQHCTEARRSLRDRDGTGSEPLTRDPSRSGRFWRADPTRSLSVLWLFRSFWRRYAASECFLPKVYGLCSTQTDHENFQHYFNFIKYWKVKIKC